MISEGDTVQSKAASQKKKKNIYIYIHTHTYIYIFQGFPSSSDGKESAGNGGHPRSISGSGRYPGGGHGNPLEYSCPGKIPWTEEPGGLQSMGLQRVKHD